MANALVSAILGKLATIISEEAWQKVRLIKGAEEEIDKVRSNLESIGALLDDAEEREMRDKSIKLWLRRLKEASLDMEDVLDEWNTALMKRKMDGAQNDASVLHRKVRHFISCFCFRRVVKLHSVAVQIKEINGRLDEIAKQKDRFSLVPRGIRQPHQVQPERETTSFVDDSIIHGRDKVKKRVISHLLDRSTEELGDLQTISIAGMGGIGKTALAQILYNDDQIEAHFDKRVWVCVSDLFDVARVARAIIIELEDQAHTSVFLLNSQPLQSLFEKICVLLEGKKFFLVLDDVWTEDGESWDPLKQTFKHGAPGSRILVTTRKDTVAEMMATSHSHVFHLEELSHEVCWSILSQRAFIGKDNKQRADLNDIGQRIAKKCKGLPLAAKTLGSLLRYKRTREEWKDVLNNEIWTSEVIQKDIFAPLLLSYYDLPSEIRQCLLYCAVLPKDFEIWAHHLIQHWMAQGYLNSSNNAEMESIGRGYFDYLAARSFFQDFGRLRDGYIYKCKMHDIVHDFVRFLTESDFVTKEVNSSDSTVELQPKAHHLTVMLAEQTSLPASIHGTEKLRSVVTFCGREAINNTALSNLFKQSKRLRLLEFGWPDGINHFRNGIPDEIGQLMHLRLLNLTFAVNMTKLPEAICELCNLLSLSLKGCHSLQELPDGIGKLINLRFFSAAGCFALTWYPKSMGRLTSLRELVEVNIRADHNDPKEFCIGDLENLCHLRRLWVKLVGNSIDVNEAQRARLHDKIHLQEMKIDLHQNIDRGYAVATLNPPPNLNVQFWTSYTDWYY